MLVGVVGEDSGCEELVGCEVVGCSSWVGILAFVVLKNVVAVEVVGCVGGEVVGF